jgi:AraC family transcriptional regulator of arabinose operon
MSEESEFFETSRYRCLVYHQKQTEDIYLTLCGFMRCQPGNLFYTKGRPGYHLHVILSGCGTLAVEGVEQQLHSGQMFITKPGEETLYTPDEKDPWTYCWMTFDGNNAPIYCAEAGFVDGTNALDCHVECQMFLNLVQRILEKSELTVANDLMRQGIMLEYIGLAIESYARSKQGAHRHHEYAPDTYAQHAVDFIRNNFASITVNEVAKYIGIHRSYLTSIFKKKFGVSPQEYLLRYKLDVGRRMLLETGVPIQEIAQRVGYDNPLTFSKMFKNVYGISPRGYRKVAAEGKIPQTTETEGEES